MVLDGAEQSDTLFQLVKKPYETLDKSLSTIAFHDNSSAQRGQPTRVLLPSLSASSVGATPFRPTSRDMDVTLTVETHNFPCGIAPLPGAETGVGGRLRDGQSTGRGSLVQAGIAGYAVGNLRLPNTCWRWEDLESVEGRQDMDVYPPNMATPLDILVSASNGAADYGNKFGEPLVAGFARSYGARTPEGRRLEWIKPIMLSGGVGRMDHNHKDKAPPAKGHLVIKLGGPAYRIGVGGGAASSMVAGDNAAELDFNAVQRGDAEMLQRVNRVVASCVELGPDNPIVSIHDQGAGGAGNVLKEIAAPAGADIDVRRMLSGDETLSTLELWAAEYQENDALLIAESSLPLFTSLCERENAPFAVVGTITGDGRISVRDGDSDRLPVQLPLDRVLASMPQKEFTDTSVSPPTLSSLSHVASLETHIATSALSGGRMVSVVSLLEDILHLVSVGCKRFLTTKVDRSVTGLVAQQQCVGPRHLPLADVAVVAESALEDWGTAVAIGEQPLKGAGGSVEDCRRMARLTIAEALTNLCAVAIRGRTTIKASGNWMWPAKLPGEACRMYACCQALSRVLVELGIVIDGGKDSLSMAARLPKTETHDAETVQCPGTLVASLYAVVPDVTIKATPDLKAADNVLIYLDYASFHGMAGTALTQVTSGVCSDAADVDVEALAVGFDAVQRLLLEREVVSYHDVSDGGVIVTVLEMAFGADNLGVDVSLPRLASGNLTSLFTEAPGCVLEVSPSSSLLLLPRLASLLPDRVHRLGTVTAGTRVVVSIGAENILCDDVDRLRSEWEATAFLLEKQQAAPEVVDSERAVTKGRVRPQYHLSFSPEPTADLQLSQPPKVAIVREEGSNGDREMAMAFSSVGFEVWDVCMSDLAAQTVSLRDFRAAAFVGGFSYADTFGSAKGWAAKIMLSPTLRKEFDAFFSRSDTLALGVCNGCQLLTLLGVVGKNELQATRARCLHNTSGRFESRFSTLLVSEQGPCSAVWTKGMGGSRLGVWVAHGEGRFHFPNPSTLDYVQAEQLVPFRYTDDQGVATEVYPMNPNGSPAGLASLCSPDGRFLAMMPHPERLMRLWNWPWVPDEWCGLTTSPWQKMFQNAMHWCVQGCK